MLFSTKVGRGNKNVERVGCATTETASAEKKLLSARSSVSTPCADSCRSNWIRGTMNGARTTTATTSAAPTGASSDQLRLRNAAIATIKPYARPPNTTKYTLHRY